MIHYQLNCTANHLFDGWFRDSASFDNQAVAGLVACPECGDLKVRRALMAPALGRKRNRAGPPANEVAPGPPQVASTPTPPQNPALQQNASVLPDQVRAMLQKLRAEVEQNCEHVGARFAEEARAIHNGTSEARGIYGESTPEQVEALADDGIEVARIPWIPRSDG